MTTILVLGAGFVAGPLVRSFLNRPDTRVRVADIEPDKARALVGDHPAGEALALDLSDEAKLRREIAAAGVVVSLVPFTFHPAVARLCVAEKKSMITTSYAGEAMRALDAEAKAAGIVLVNEVGLDPGIDHMEAMRIIDEVRSEGGKVLGFTSFCGGLPAPEANTNPFGYKFSWSPRGVLLAGKNDARYLKDGKEVFVPGEQLFAACSTVAVDGLGEFEAYPNRNSLSYIDLYGIPETRTMLRGTLRWPGWCRTLKKISEMGLLDATEKNLAGMTAMKFLRSLLGMPADWDIKKAVRDRFKLDPGTLERLDWLGLFGEEPLGLERGAALDALESLMTKKLGYARGERDMVVLRHDFLIEDKNGKRERISSTLIDFGLPGGDSAMARTVAFPAAAATRLVLEGGTGLTGVRIPVERALYAPILKEIRSAGIVFREARAAL
jgi:saccharopine dehydrogenase (NADP+, L-glutamate forming)